ncbi:hypothetical protein NO135_25780, partial [Clostridioides difficile]|nr:hypothetical protein [Clostridioides difficile]
ADLAFAGREHGTLLLGGRGVCRLDSVGPQPSIARCRALAEVLICSRVTPTSSKFPFSSGAVMA